MPAVEAMACGCPVITTKRGSLAEVAGDATEFVSGDDPAELLVAMRSVDNPVRRQPLIEAGIARSKSYSWDQMAERIHDLLKKAVQESKTPASQSFYNEWKRLRSIQADVDIGI